MKARCGFTLRLGMVILAIAVSAPAASAEDFFLTIAGGYSPTGNQASLEKNVLFYQRLLADQKLTSRPSDIFFADGLSKDPSLQVLDRNSLPPANRLMAEFFGSQRNLGLQYRAHAVPGIRGQTSIENIDKWFAENSPRMKKGDRLILYVSAHGGNSTDSKKPYNTTIYLWNNKNISVSELSDRLDRLPDGVSVVTFMVQCHAGGFAQLVHEHGDPDGEISRQNRCGFFATVHSRPAAGCTPEIDEENYEEYSTYFLAALAGKSRAGQPIKLPDYNGNAVVSFDEAHAYTVLSANTIDLPIKTSDEYLRKVSEFGSESRNELLFKDTPWETVLKLAGPADRAVLEGLSTKLELSGDNRIADARKAGSQRPGSGSRGSRTQGSTRRGGRTASEVDRLKQSIVNDTKKRWPELANVLNPVAIELLTTRQAEFVNTIESHKDYPRYRELADQSAVQNSSEKSRVKYERFVRVAENVILAENLVRMGDAKPLEAYRRILKAESDSLVPRRANTIGTAKSP